MGRGGRSKRTGCNMPLPIMMVDNADVAVVRFYDAKGNKRKGVGRHITFPI